ncbi:MAG: hypothetical protein ACE37E_07145 [Hyphomicrobiales bacterium]
MNSEVQEKIEGLDHPVPSDMFEMEDGQADKFAKILNWQVAKLKENEIDLKGQDLFEVAYRNIQYLVHLAHTTNKEQAIKEKIQTREIFMAVGGTLIWGFGDWPVNFFVHCGKLTCA